MKHSVNGKSFDEIFAQRGKAILISETKRDDYYLIECDTFGIVWVSKFDHIDDMEFFREKSISNISNCGRFYGYGMIWVDEITAIYEASQDQIALLNSYKNQNK